MTDSEVLAAIFRYGPVRKELNMPAEAIGRISAILKLPVSSDGTLDVPVSYGSFILTADD